MSSSPAWAEPRAREAGYYPEFDATALMRADAAGRSAYYHGGLQDGWLSVNDVRSREGMNRVAGGDQRFVQLNMQTLEQAAQNAAAATTKAAGPAVDLTGVLEVLAQVSAGSLSKSSAVALVLTAFPTVTPQQAVRIVYGASAVPASVDGSLATTTADAGVQEPVLQDTALNGAQVAALLQILASITAGALSKESAVSIIMAAFPTIAEPVARRIVDGAVVSPDQPTAVAPPAANLVGGA